LADQKQAAEAACFFNIFPLHKDVFFILGESGSASDPNQKFFVLAGIAVQKKLVDF